jgi:hypothetical protein
MKTDGGLVVRPDQSARSIESEIVLVLAVVARARKQCSLACWNVVLIISLLQFIIQSRETGQAERIHEALEVSFLAKGVTSIADASVYARGNEMAFVADMTVLLLDLFICMLIDHELKVLDGVVVGVIGAHSGSLVGFQILSQSHTIVLV